MTVLLGQRPRKAPAKKYGAAAGARATGERDTRAYRVDRGVHGSTGPVAGRTRHTPAPRVIFAILLLAFVSFVIFPFVVLSVEVSLGANNGRPTYGFAVIPRIICARKIEGSLTVLLTEGG